MFPLDRVWSLTELITDHTCAVLLFSYLYICFSLFIVVVSIYIDIICSLLYRGCLSVRLLDFVGRLFVFVTLSTFSFILTYLNISYSYSHTFIHFRTHTHTYKKCDLRFLQPQHSRCCSFFSFLDENSFWIDLQTARKKT